MSKISLEPNASGAGTFTLAAPNSNTNRTLTLPDASGTLARTESLVGQVCFFAMDTAPDGFLKANGAAVSRTTFSALFNAIGTAFGAGDGSTTFNLPDMRGEFPRGWDDGRGVDSGRSFGTAQLDQFSNHIHRVSVNDHPNKNISLGGGASVDENEWVSGSTNIGFLDNHRWGGGSGSRLRALSAQNSDSVKASTSLDGETRSRNVALLACIKF